MQSILNNDNEWSCSIVTISTGLDIIQMENYSKEQSHGSSWYSLIISGTLFDTVSPDQPALFLGWPIRTTLYILPNDFKRAWQTHSRLRAPSSMQNYHPIKTYTLLFFGSLGTCVHPFVHSHKLLLFASAGGLFF